MTIFKHNNFQNYGIFQESTEELKTENSYNCNSKGWEKFTITNNTTH